MKIFLILCGFVTVVSALKQEKYKLPEDKLLKVKKITGECAQEHNVDDGLLPAIADGTIPRTEANNKFIYCFLTKVNMVKEDGHIDIDKVASYLGDHPLVEDFKVALRKCDEVTKGNFVLTAVEMNRCYAESAPVLFAVE